MKARKMSIVFKKSRGLLAAIFAALICCVCSFAYAGQAEVFAHSAVEVKQEPEPKEGTRVVSLRSQFWGWIVATQARLNRELIAATRAVRGDSPLDAALLVVAIAFGYGVLHAAGPGHGKAVISSYVLANEQTVRRGIALSFLAALFQACSAILFVGALLLIMRQTGLTMRLVETQLETLSWILIALVGIWMLVRQAAASGKSARSRTWISAERVRPSPSHTHTHGADCGCGHAHIPAPQALGGPWSWKNAVPIALAVGMRPCTGAILLLTFTAGQGLIWVGVVGSFAMALGTAITVSVLAAFAVSSRYWAMRLLGPDNIWSQRLGYAMGHLAALLVILLGVVGAVGSFSTPRPFGV